MPRIVTGGLPPIEGRTVLEKRRFFRDNLDHIRTALMWEPRGHADMYGAVVTPSQEADFDVFFLHNEGYSTMCGHAVIALTKLAAEMGLGREHEGWREVTIDVPAGRITARAEMRDGLAVRSFFRNVPSFVLLRDQEIEVAGVGRVRFDVAYGGAFYAFVDATQLELPLTPDQVQRHIDLGRRIKRAVASSHRIEHPFEEAKLVECCTQRARELGIKELFAVTSRTTFFGRLGFATFRREKTAMFLELGRRTSAE